MTRARRAGRPGPTRWILYVGAVVAIAWFATQVFYFVQIGIWNYVNPQSTAFMRSDAWTLSQDRPDLSIQHTWVFGVVRRSPSNWRAICFYRGIKVISARGRRSSSRGCLIP